MSQKFKAQSQIIIVNENHSPQLCWGEWHLRVATTQKLSISNFMGYLKGKSTLMIYDRHHELQSKWDKAFGARGYYVGTIGNITDEAV